FLDGEFDSPPSPPRYFPCSAPRRVGACPSRQPAASSSVHVRIGIVASYTANVPLPAALAAYIAASARSSISSAVGDRSDATATPIEQPTTTDRPPSCI